MPPVVRESLSCRPIEYGKTDTINFVALAKLHRDECASHLPFEENCVARNCLEVYEDKLRNRRQAWMLFKGERAIGYMVAHATPYYFCTAVSASTEVIFVDPEHRSWKAFAALMKAYDEWCDSIDAVQRFTGVARVDAEIAERMQKLFPRLGYNWCGSYYVKEIGR